MKHKNLLPNDVRDLVSGVSQQGHGGIDCLLRLPNRLVDYIPDADVDNHHSNNGDVYTHYFVGTNEYNTDVVFFSKRFFDDEYHIKTLDNVLFEDFDFEVLDGQDIFPLHSMFSKIFIHNSDTYIKKTSINTYTRVPAVLSETTPADTILVNSPNNVTDSSAFVVLYDPFGNFIYKRIAYATGGHDEQYSKHLYTFDFPDFIEKKDLKHFSKNDLQSYRFMDEYIASQLDDNLLDDQ